jgi:antitoxin HigA-1
MDRARMTRTPTTPGEILREEFLLPLEMSQKELADHIGQDVKVINRIVNGRSAVTAEVALKLGATFSTTPEFWLNAQKAVDLFAARSKLRRLPKALVPGRRPAA